MINNLNRLFHWCVINPEFLKGEVSKHLDIPEDKIKLEKYDDTTNDDGEIVSCRYILNIDGEEFVFNFNKKIREIEAKKVPKVIKKKKKWWQGDTDELEVVIEDSKPMVKSMSYWVITSITEAVFAQ